MKVAVLTSLYPSPPRPFEGIFAERRWSYMAARGHQIHVVHPQPFIPPGTRALLPEAWRQISRMPRRELRAGIPVTRPRYLHFPRRASGNARRFASCALAHLEQSDVVVCDYAWPASAVAPELRRRGQPCVISGRGSDVLQVAGEAGLGPELRRNLRAAGSWCAVSRDLVSAMDRLAGEDRGRLVPNGVDLETFQLGDRSRARASLGLDPSGPVVLVVGHLIARKDPLLSLRAFLSGAPPAARLFFVGRGPLAGELEQAVARHGALDRVVLLGEKDPWELAEWLVASDLLLLTSHREGRPNVVLEALACGRPVLATAAGGTAEVLPEKRMLATSRAPDSIGAQLAQLLADPSEPAALRASVDHLSWDNSMQALEDCLETAVGAPEVLA